MWRSERRYRGLRPTFIGRGPKQTRTFATDTGRFGDRQALGCCPCLENRVRLCAEALPLKSVIFYSAPHLTRSPSIRPRNGMDEVYITSWLGLAGTALHGGDTLPLLARAIASGLGNDETTRGGGHRVELFPVATDVRHSWRRHAPHSSLLAPLSTEAIHLGRRVGRSLQPLPAEAVGWHSSAANWFTSMFLAAVEGAGSQPSDRTRRVR